MANAVRQIVASIFLQLVIDGAAQNLGDNARCVRTNRNADRLTILTVSKETIEFVKIDHLRVAVLVGLRRQFPMKCPRDGMSVYGRVITLNVALGDICAVTKTL